MRDKQDAYPSRFDATNQLKQEIDFPFGQCSSWLIHQQQTGLRMECAGDFHHLLLGDGQFVNGLVRINRYAEHFQQQRRLAIEFVPVDHGQMFEVRFSAEEDVLAHAQLRDQIGFLIKNLNSGIACIMGCSE